MRTNRSFSRGRLSLLAAVAILFTGCTVQEQKMPDLAGPSELGLGMSLTAAPEFHDYGEDVRLEREADGGTTLEAAGQRRYAERQRSHHRH
jgi:hypothetical protein